MAGFIPDEIIERIRSHGDIVELIQSYIPLKRAGARYKALCPFHNEKTPSFTVDPGKQMFHCFGCGKGGDLFRFVMDRENLDFNEAVRLLAQRYRIDIVEKKSGDGRGAVPSDTGTKERLLKINELMAQWFENNLHGNPDSEVAKYLRKRDLPDELIRKFHLGAAPDSWDESINFCRKHGFKDSEIILSGVAVKNEDGKVYDRFRKRLVFPIMDELGRVVGFSARTIENVHEGAKYVNSPETPIFKKSRILYGLNFVKEFLRENETDFIVLCEGQFDVMAMHCAGFPNSVAPQGTAFTEDQARILKRYTNRIVLALDADEAGTKAVLRDLEILLPLDFEVRIIGFPKGEDPDSLLKREGAAFVGDLIRNGKDFFDFLLELFSSRFDPATPWGQSNIVSQILNYMSKIGNFVARSAYAAKLAEKLHINEKAVFDEMNKMLKKNQMSHTPEIHSAMQPSVSNASVTVAKAEETLLELALTHGTVGQYLADKLPAEIISDTPVGKALETVISMTLNGEWENASKKITLSLCENPNPVLSRIVSQSTGIEQKKMEKAVSECVNAIRRFHLQNEIEALMRKWKSSGGEEEKQAVRKQYLIKQKELKEFMPKTAGNN